MKILIILLSLTMAMPLCASEEIFKDAVGIASTCIVMPVGRVLLIGRGNFVGAVKFLQNEERQGDTHSRYEYFEYEREGFKKIREGEVLLKKPSGGKGWFFHQSPYELAGSPLKLRDFNLFAMAGGKEHSTVYFWTAPEKPDLKVRMAPTIWKDVSEVNITDSRIRWYTYDSKESWKVIPIDKIWRTEQGGPANSAKQRPRS